MNEQHRRIQSELEYLAFLEKAGIDGREYIANKLLAHRGSALVERNAKELHQRALIQTIRKKHYRPPISPGTPILPFGHDIYRREPVGPEVEHVPSGILLAGGSGSGKTNCILLLIAWLVLHGIKVRFWDYKSESTRLPFYWPEAITFDLHTAPWHFLHPVGDHIAYYTGIIGELRHEFELHTATFPLLWSIMERILRGMRPGDPYPSWEDLLLVVEHEAVSQNRENLHTVARVLRNLCVLLGRQARIRRAPDISDRYKVIAYSFVGQDPRILRLFLGFHFTRLILAAQAQRHTTDLREVDIIDEGSVLFSSELAQLGATHISPAKRMASMARSTGTSLIVGMQNLSQTDAFLLQNIGTLCCFRSPSWDDALAATRMLGLPRDAVDELMRLPRGQAYLRSVGWEQAVKIQIPPFRP